MTSKEGVKKRKNHGKLNSGTRTSGNYSNNKRRGI
jgi:hypothetical protein